MVSGELCLLCRRHPSAEDKTCGMQCADETTWISSLKVGVTRQLGMAPDNFPLTLTAHQYTWCVIHLNFVHVCAQGFSEGFKSLDLTVTLHAFPADANPLPFLTCVKVAVADSVAVGGTAFVAQRRGPPWNWGLRK